MRLPLILLAIALRPVSPIESQQSTGAGVSVASFDSNINAAFVYEKRDGGDSLHVVAILVTHRTQARSVTDYATSARSRQMLDSAALASRRLGRMFGGSVSTTSDESIAFDRKQRIVFVHGQQFAVPLADSAVLIIVDSVDTHPTLQARNISSPIDGLSSNARSTAEYNRQRQAWRSRLLRGWLERTLREPSVFALTQVPIGREGIRNSALGCWSLRDSAGRSAQGNLYWSPAITRLSATRDSSQWSQSFPSSRDASRLDSLGRDLSARDDPRKRGWGFWSADASSDSIRVGFSSGFSGTWFVLSLPQGAPVDTLYGRAFEHWDHAPTTDRGRASAVRVPCPGVKIP